MVDRPVRVLALVTDAFGGHGGIAQYNRNLLMAMAHGTQIDQVLILPRAVRTAVDSLPDRIQQFSPVSGRLAYCLATLRLALTHRSIDIVFCGHIFMAPLAAIVARLLHARLWTQVHGVEAWHELSWPYRHAVEAADLITSVSRYTKLRLLGWLDIDPTRVRILPNTVDSRFRPGPKPSYLLDRHAAHGKKILMTVSRLAAVERYKGHDRVIRALPRILAAYPGTMYFVIGDGDDRPRLEALTLQYGLEDKVKFLGSVIDKELPDYYRLADVLVMPSTGEGFGIVFLEALASGIHAVGGNRDGSVDPLAEFGHAIDPDSDDELVSAISNCLSKPFETMFIGRKFGAHLFSDHVQSLIDCNRIKKSGLA